MADKKLMFPVGFDLKQGTADAINDWKTTYHKKLQDAVGKKPIKVKLQLDSKGIDLNSLKDITKLTKEAATAAKRLADVRAKEANARTKEAAARQRESSARVAESTEETKIAREKIKTATAQERLNRAKERGARNARALTNEYKKQSSYVGRLIQRLGIYTSIYAAAGMIRSIREVTAEFELQQVALGAIIQDAHQASVLFSQIKAAAVESPYQIKELVNYTKQLAAYGFKQNELFDTTMRLADISAGLGADMSRIILAVGQISAATVLKGTELRQLTELGLPMVQLLADKLTQLRGEVVSTGEVFEMISDKAISFKMVEEILNDLTSAGGMFYDVQKKQAKTLEGQWSNLKDTIAITYDEIGNTDVVRGIMEWWINTAKDLADNWASLVTTIGGVVSVVAIIKSLNGVLAFYVNSTQKAKVATGLYVNSLRKLSVASQGGNFMRLLALQNVYYTKTMRQAAAATNIFKKAWLGLKAVVGGNWITIAVAAVAALVVWITNAVRKSNELEKSLSKIRNEGATKMEQSERNFERLANIIVNSADGTKKQTEALKELQRTYGDIIPFKDMTVERLRDEKQGYDDLTDAIREKIAMQTLEQKIGKIEEYYSRESSRHKDRAEKYLAGIGLSSDEINRVLNNLASQAQKGIINTFRIGDSLKKALSEETMFDASYLDDDSSATYNYIWFLVKKESEIKSVTKSMESQTKALGKYTKFWEKASEEITDSIRSIDISPNTKLYDEAVEKAKVEKYSMFLQKVLGDVFNVDFNINDYIDGGVIDFDSLLGLSGLTPQARKSIQSVQKELEGFTDWKKTFKDTEKDVTIGKDNRKFFLYTDEELTNFGNLKTALEDVAKKWKDYDEEVTRYGKALKGSVNPEEKEGIENKKKQAEEYKNMAYYLLEYYNALDLIEKKGGGEDPWIIVMKNRMSFMKDFQQGVENLSKKMSAATALESQKGIMTQRGASVDIDVSSLTGSADELSKWYDDAINKVISKIQGLGGKAFEGLGVQAILAKDTKSRMIKAYQEFLQELFNQKTDFQTKTLEENLKKEIDRLATAVSRSKEAKDFFDKILGMTGDKELSANLTMSLYGGVGDDLQQNIEDQLKNAFTGIDITSAFSNGKVDYKKLESLIPELPEDKRANASKLVQEGLNDEKKFLLDLLKTYEKFNEFEKRRTTVMQREAEIRKKIQENSSLDDTQKKELTDASHKREQSEKLKIDIEEFKASKDWAKSFEETENLATSTINRLMDKLKGFMDLNAAALAENPEQLKTLMNEYQKLYDAVIARNPFTAISDGIKEYVEATQKITIARQRMSKAAKGTKDYADAESELADAQDKQQKAMSKTQKGFQAASSAVSNLGNLMTQLIDIFGVAEDSEFGAFVQNLVKWLGVMATVLGVVASIIAIIEAELTPLLAVAAAIAAVGAAITWISEAKVREANKKIKEQEKLLENLEYQYEKLEKAAESAFGTEYLENYNKRLRNLMATQSAYLAQAEAEREKGKQADEEAIKDYEDSAREAADSIADMYGEISERMLGTSLGDAARDFAESWIEAYKSFGNTANAIGEKFKEMIDNFVVESAIAGVMKAALKPVFDLVDNMTKEQIYDPEFWQNLETQMKDSTAAADEAALRSMTMLESMGINIRQLGGDLTGISKDIATASEESILGLSAGINTQNFYISQIHAAVLRMETIMQGSSGVNVQDLITIQNQHLSHLPNIADNTANTLAECRSILMEVRRISENTDRIISPRGTQSTHVINASFS